MEVKSPNEREWERIDLELKAALRHAEKSGENDLIQLAKADLQKHLERKQKYIDAGRNQLTIFDL